MIATRAPGGRRAPAPDVAPAMGPRVGPFLAFQVVLSGSLVVVQSAAFGQFVTVYGVAALPFAYVVMAVVSALIVLAHRWFGARVPLRRRLSAGMAAMAVGSGAMGFALAAAPTGWIVMALPIWFHGFATLAGLTVWPLALRIIGSGAGRAPFARVSAGQWAAYVLGGLAVTPLVVWFGSALMLLSATAGVLLAWALLHVTIREVPGSDEPAGTPMDEVSPVPRRDYRTLIVGSLALSWIAYVFVEVLFYHQAAGIHGDAAQLTAFIGRLLALAGAVGLVTSLIATRMLRQFGLAVGLLATPVVVLIGLLALAVADTLGLPAAVLLWLASAAKLVMVALGLSLSQTAMAVVYQALPERAPPSAPVPSELVRAFATLLAGAGLVALVTIGGVGGGAIAWVSAALAAAWCALTYGVARGYPTTFTTALAARRWGRGAGITLDATGVEVLRRHLASPHPGAVIYALERLAEQGVTLTTTDVMALLAHPVAEVRDSVLRTLEGRAEPDFAPLLRRHLASEKAPAGRSATLRALASCGAAIDAPLLTTALTDPDPVVRSGAIAGLLRHGGPTGARDASAALSRLVSSSVAHERMVAAHVLAAGDMPDAYALLRDLLDDQDADVRRAAVQAAGEAQHPLLWPEVVRAGDAPGTARHVERALADGGDAALDAIEASLADPDLPPAMVVMLVRTCGRMSGPRAVRLLEARLDAPVAAIRWSVLQALAACRYRAGAPERVRSDVLGCIERMHWIDETLMTLEDAPPAPLLVGALADAWRREQDMMVLLLAQVGDGPAILAARAELARAVPLDTDRVLDLAGAGVALEWRQLTLAWLTASPDAARARGTIVGVRPFLAARLEALIVGPEATWFGSWPTACALHAVATHGLPASAAALESAEDSPDSLVAGTARWARLRRAGQHTGRDGDMLSSLERVLILKTVQIFAGTPDAVLADIAEVLDEVDVAPGEAIIRQGDMGDSMYIVVAGEVAVHDGARRLDTLGERQAFGEMALLDPEPRVASVTAIDATRLLRLPQAPFHELLHDRPEIAIGIMRVLTQRLRDRIKDLAEARGGGSVEAEGSP